MSVIVRAMCIQRCHLMYITKQQRLKKHRPQKKKINAHETKRMFNCISFYFFVVIVVVVVDSVFVSLFLSVVRFCCLVSFRLTNKVENFVELKLMPQKPNRKMTVQWKSERDRTKCNGFVRCEFEHSQGLWH